MLRACSAWPLVAVSDRGSHIYMGEQAGVHVVGSGPRRWPSLGRRTDLVGYDSESRAGKCVSDWTHGALDASKGHVVRMGDSFHRGATC